jgi:rhodanese-related sulfurtransferase
VRTPAEYEEGHIDGALHIPIDELRARLHEIPAARRVAVYCRSGFRGHLASRILVQRGWRDVVNVTGGWLSIALGGRV